MSMLKTKTECNYDEENDILFIYRADRSPKASIELDKNLVLDLDAKGSVCAVEIFDAIKTFSGLSEFGTSANFFRNIKVCKLTSNQIGNLQRLKIYVLSIAGNTKQEVEVPLIASIGGYRSPAIRYA